MLLYVKNIQNNVRFRQTYGAKCRYSQHGTASVRYLRVYKLSASVETREAIVEGMDSPSGCFSKYYWSRALIHSGVLGER